MLFKENQNSYNITMSKIDFETTRLYLNQKTNTDKDLTLLQYSDNILFYDRDILLENVTVFDKTIDNNFINIKICTKNKYKICQDMIIKQIY